MSFIWIRRASRLLKSLSLALAIAIASPLALHAADLVQFEIPAQDLGSALRSFAKAAHQQIVFDSKRVQGLKSTALSGTYSVDDALHLLLQDSGLSLNKTAAGVFYVQEKSDGPLDASRAPAIIPGRKEGLEEIIVTAQKREQRLQDVPVPVTVLNPDTLAENNQNRLQDYFASVPGLSLISSGGGTQQLSIRGVSTGGFANPTVGVTIDDVPYGSSTNLADGQDQYPDLDPSDLERIEVLRGPQGTLYGASSIGGLIKFVTKNPTTEELSGRVQVLGDDVDHGAFGFGARGAINVPITDTFAIRASGFTRRDPGYIDNIITGQNDVNRVDVHGGHFVGLWHLSDRASLKFSALLQDTHGDAPSTVDANAQLQPVLGDLKQAGIPGTGQYSTQVRSYAATLQASLGGLDFVSISGYGINKNSQLADLSIFGSGTSLGHEWETKKLTQEFRLSSTGQQTLEWVAGAFYTHESSSSDEFVGTLDPTGSPVGVIADFNSPTTVSEYAVFGDITVHFTDRFDVQFGGRESENRQVYDETDSSQGSAPFINQTEHTKGNAFTYLLTPQFKISSDLSVYARFASGYRVGGPNLNAVQGGVPIQYDPDRAYSYDVGVKGELPDRALTFDASVYYIDWKRIQLSFFDALFQTTYLTNGGNAKSQGLELSLTARPARGLTITANASANDAQLTQDLPPLSQLFGSAGDRLPFSSRFSGSLAVDQDIELTGSWTGFVGGSVSYVGAREGTFSTDATTPRLRYPAYADVDLRTGVRHAPWVINLFANNVADRRGIVGGGPSGGTSPFAVVYIQPRTLGLSVARSF